MRNLVSREPRVVVATVGQAAYQQHVGLLTSPRSGYSPARAIDLCAPWAADNDCFRYWTHQELYNPKPLINTLRRWLPYRRHCLFINAPDVLTNAKATLEMFWFWREIIHGYGYPVAFTVQNGVDKVGIPDWSAFEALFIGATNEVKYSCFVFDLIKEARRRGKWVHNGRVNTPSAIRLSRVMGCNSFDGTGFTKETSRVKRFLPFQLAHQHHFWEKIP